MDLDGTFLRNDHISASKRNIQAVKAAKEKGVEVVISTGRPLSFTKEIRQWIGQTNYGVFSNGSSIVDLNQEKEILSALMPLNSTNHVLDVMSNYKVSMIVHKNGVGHIQKGGYFNSPWLEHEFLNRVQEYCISVDNLEKEMYNNEVEKIDILSLPKDNQDKIEKQIKEDCGVVISSSLPGNIEINSKKATKGKALERLCTKLEINQDQVMALGDSTNDIEMLKWAGYSFAMENGKDEAKAVAKYIAPHFEKDGLAQMIEKHVL